MQIETERRVKEALHARENAFDEREKDYSRSTMHFTSFVFLSFHIASHVFTDLSCHIMRSESTSSVTGARREKGAIEEREKEKERERERGKETSRSFELSSM